MSEPESRKERRERAFRAYLWVLAGSVVVLLLVGYSPTRRLAGEGGVIAMLAGCAASIAGSLFSSWWLRSQASTVSTSNVVTLMLGSLASRLAITVVVGAGLLLTNVFAPKPMLLWLAASHAALLLADTRYALTVAGQLETAAGNGPGASPTT